MGRLKRIEITIETDRVVIIRRKRSTRVWCQECGCEADMVDMITAAELIEMTGRMLREGLEAKGWHVCQSSDGSPRICLESLLNSFERKKS